MLPKIAKAVIKGLLVLVFFYIIPTMLLSSLSELSPEIASRYEQLLLTFVAIILFFTVASELTAGTIFQHGFNIGKAIILMIFIIFALEGGIVFLDMQGLQLVADLRIYLAMLLTIDLLGLAKSVLQALNFLSERTEKQHPTPKPS